MTIEEIIEEAKRICFSSNPQDYIQFVGELAELKPEQLPANLDDAAEKYALKTFPKEEGKAFHSYFGTIEFDKNASMRTGAITGFIAGAKWMAEQGVSYTDKIYNWSDDDKLDGVDENKFTLDGFGEEEALLRGVKQGLFRVRDKVIVQIRKEE